jgi:hypothetical protein
VALVDNRRTMCDHCSLRRDLPGFIDRDHAQGNIDRILNDDFFPCHMAINNPAEIERAKICLGAALIGGADLVNPPAENIPPVHHGPREYVDYQASTRKTSDWLLVHGDVWMDSTGALRYGWWEKSLEDTWQYFMVSLAENDASSVYLFFDQCQSLFGPLKKLEDQP